MFPEIKHCIYTNSRAIKAQCYSKSRCFTTQLLTQWPIPKKKYIYIYKERLLNFIATCFMFFVSRTRIVFVFFSISRHASSRIPTKLSHYAHYYSVHTFVWKEYRQSLNLEACQRTLELSCVLTFMDSGTDR